MKLVVLVLIAFSSITLSQSWVTDFRKGVELAKAQKKEVLIYFYGEHCPYCLQMEEFVLGDPEVDSYIRERFVVVSINVTESQELDRKFGVLGTPYFVVYDPRSDKILYRIFGSRERDDFLNLLFKACKKSNLRRC